MPLMEEVMATLQALFEELDLEDLRKSHEYIRH